MKRRLFLPFFIFALCVALSTATFAANTETQAADALYELGLFKGTGTNSDGTPIYSLEKTPSRAEAITMLVRLLGKEKEATAKTWETPFTDVDAWADPYVGYAFNNGLTNGTSATTFGSKQNSNATQYLSFVLRSLGYSDKDGDFAWDKAWELTDELCITNGEYDAKSSFNRGNVAEVSLDALSANLKGSDKTLSDKLISEGVYTEDIYKKVLSASDTRNSAENVAKYKYAWSNQYNGYLITGFSGAGCENIILPSEYNGKPVVGLEKSALHSDVNNEFFLPVSLDIPKTFVTIGADNYFNIVTDKLETITVAKGNEAFVLKNGWLLTKDGKKTVCVCGAKGGTYILPEGVEELTYGVLHMNAEKLVLPASLKVYHYIENSNIKEFEVLDGNQAYCSVDGVLFSKDGKTLVQYPPESERTEYRIPDSVTTIAEYAFRNALNLKDIYVPKTVKSTKEHPFNFTQTTIHIEGSTSGWDNGWSDTNANKRSYYDFGEGELTYKLLPYVDDTSTAEGFALYDLEYAELPNNNGYYIRMKYHSDYWRWVNFYNAGRQDGGSGYGGDFEMCEDTDTLLKYITKQDFESYDKFVMRIRNRSAEGFSYGDHNIIIIYPNGIPEHEKRFDVEEVADEEFSAISFEAESGSLKVSNVEAAKHGEAYYFKIHFAGQTADEVCLFPAGLGASGADKQGVEGIYFEGPFQGEAVIAASSDYIFKNPINTKKMVIRFYNGKEGNKSAQLIQINTALLEKL